MQLDVPGSGSRGAGSGVAAGAQDLADGILMPSHLQFIPFHVSSNLFNDELV